MEDVGEKRVVEVGAIWSRADPSGSTEQFRIEGFQRNPYGGIGQAARARLLGNGKRIIIGLSEIATNAERFKLVTPAPAGAQPQAKLGRRKTAKDWGHPPGTPILLRLDDGTEIEARTRSEAWQTASRHGLVLVTGQVGGWSLDRVTLDKKRWLTRPSAELLTLCCEVTVLGGSYRAASAESRMLKLLAERGYTERKESGWVATAAGFEAVCLDPKDARPTLVVERPTREMRRAS